MTKDQLKQELLMAYVERKQLEELFNLVDEDFSEAITYKLKSNDCVINALKKRIKNANLEALLKDIKKETICRQTNMVSES